LALEIEVVEGTELQKKKTELVLANRTQQLTTLKVNFEDLENLLLTLTEKRKMEVLQVDAFESGKDL
jgi:hypothetical protein